MLKRMLGMCRTFLNSRTMKKSRFSIWLICILLRVTVPAAAADESQIDIDDLFLQDVSAAEPAAENSESDASAGSLDDVFDDAEDTDAENEESASSQGTDEDEQAVNLDALTTSPLKFSGSVSAGLGMGLGIREWPNQSGSGKTFWELFRPSGFYSSSALFKLDARPLPYARFYTSLEIGMDEDSMVFSGPSVKELFIDYTLQDTVFFRVGKQSLTWGQGRLLGNPANLVSRVSGGVSVRASGPAGPGTLNGVIYIKNWADNPYSEINPKSFAYAGLWEATSGAAAYSFSTHFIDDDGTEEDIALSSSVSCNLGPVDAAADVTGHWDIDAVSAKLSEQDFSVWQPDEWSVMGQLFWENADRSVSLLGEYQYDTTRKDAEHHAALAVKLPKLFGSGWRPAISWKHAFQDDGSGEIIAGISGTVAPKLSMSIGMPVLYGNLGTYYREAAYESGSEINHDALLIPTDDVASVLLAWTLSFSF